MVAVSVIKGRITANACHLCVRTAVVMAAEFCACRLALSALGVDAYGCLAAIYSIIAAFEMFNGAFEATSQRFLGIELGKGEKGDIGRAFSSILALAMFFCLGIALLAETAGFWFLAHRLVLSDAANGYAVLVYQAGMTAVLVRILQLPFTSLVLSGERMFFFSKVCWMEAAFSVAAAVLARQGPVAYVFMRLFGNVTVFFLFVIHCRRIFPQIRPWPRICPGWSSAQARFFLWSALSGIGNAFKYQGVGLVVNRYSGVAFNASFNLALKVRTLFLPLCMNILQAVAPAVYKARGRGDSRRFETLVGRSLALAIVLVAVPSLLAFLKVGDLVGMWLGVTVPPQIDLFIRCSLVNLTFDAISQPLTTAINAGGKVVLYQIVTTSLSCAGFASAFLFLSAGFPSWTSLAAVAAVNGVACAYRCFHVRVLMGTVPRLGLARAIRPSSRRSA